MMTYTALLQAGWRMNEIDSMDFIGYLKVKVWEANRDKVKREPKDSYIDSVWPGIKP